MMSSPFDPLQQENSLDARITFALERISLVFKSLLLEQGKQTNLSPIQLQILVFLLYHGPQKCKISYLATEFSLTKATVSDSVKVLIQKDLLKKIIDPQDSRSFSLNLTMEGEKQAKDAALMAAPMEQIIAKYSQDQKETFYRILFNTIQDLQINGLIPLQRMCFSCANYQSQNGKHYCKLLKKMLEDTELRLDCMDHLAVQ